MNYRRILSLFLALLMMFSTVAELIPATAFASEIQEETQTTEENADDVIARYEIPLDEVTLNEDGSLHLDLSDFEHVETESEVTESAVTESAVTEPAVTEPAVTEPAVTEPAVTEPAVTEPAVTEPEVAEPEVSEPAVTEPAVTEPAVTEPEVTEPEASEPATTEPVVTEPLTWFQWIEEKGVDTAALTKDEYSALTEEYAAYRANTLAQMEELPEGGSSGSIANNYIEVAVSQEGKFSIGTRTGNPSYSSDDYKKLLFGHPNPGTSNTLITIDGNYETQFYADTCTYSYNTATATMNIRSYGIKVVQTLKLIKVGSAGFEDTVQIQYQVYNNSNRNHDVGIRIMMDTMLANNDHATYHLTSMGHVTTARVFTGSAIPSTYQFYDNINSPTTIATGYLYRSGDRKPDKVQFCNWAGIVSSHWNHQVNNGDYLGDSAVGIYFNPKTIKPGKNTSVRTYYGVSVGTASGDSTEVGSDQVLLMVKDSYTQEPLEGVSVSYKIGMEANVRTATTDSNGQAILEGFASSREAVPTMITLTKEGYKRNSYRANLRGGTTSTQQMSLEDAPKPIINSILLDTGSSQVNLLTGSYTADEDPNDYIGKKGATGTVTIKATSDMEDCIWYLVQDEKVIQRSPNGEFTFNIREVTKDNGDKRTYIEEFTPDGNRYIQCVSPQGEKSEKMRFGLNIRAGIELKFGDLDMGKVWPSVDGTLVEGSLGALFLGNKITLGPKNSKFKVFAELTEDGVVRVGINYDIAKYDEFEKGDEDSTKRIENFEKNIKKQLTNFVKGKNTNIKSTVKKVGKFDYGAGTAEFIFCGYGEGQVENGAARVDVTVMLAVKADGHHTWQFLAWSVPVYVDVGAEFKAELSASANIMNTEGLGFRFYNAEFSPAFSLWLEGGAGVKKALSIGVRGNATVSLDWNLVTQYVRADLTGSASLVAEAFGIFEKDLEFARATVPIYDSNRDGDALGGEDNIFQLLQERPFRLITREESADGGTSQYATNARIVTVNGQQYKFFATDRGGDLSNRYMLCWSKLVNGSWTDATPVANDGTSDLYYDVAVSGSDIYVVWSNSSKVFNDETVTLDEFAAAQEIYMAVINTTTGTTGDALQLTSNTIMDSQPAVTVLDGTAYVAWSHTANSMEDMTDVHDNYLQYTSVTGGTAGETVSVNFEKASINTVSASAASGKPLATIVSNASDEYSIADNETTVVDMSNATKTEVDTTDKVIGKTVTGTINGTEQVFWMENGNVAYADSITSENPTYIFSEDTIPGSISEDNYTVISANDTTYLIWSQGSGEEGVPASAMTTIYCNGTWSGVHKLTDLSTGNITVLDGYMNAEGKLVLVYTVKTIYENAEGNSSMTSRSLEKIVEPEQSVRIANFDFEISDAIPGQILPLKLEVVNTGNTTVDSLDLHINSEAGENYNETLTGLNIAPGASAVLEINDFILSSSLTTRTTSEGQYIYTLTAKATGSEILAEEIFEIGYDNVVLYKRDTAYVDNRENLVIAVENQSGFPAADVRVQILADAIDGVLIYDKTFDEIAAGDMMTIYLPVEDLDSTSLFAFVSTAATPSGEDDYYELILSNISDSATLSMETLGCGTVTPAGEQIIAFGETVSIEAIPDAGYLFDGWYSNREMTFLSGSEDTARASIEMPAGNTIVTARFVSQTPYDFTLSAESASIYAGDEYALGTTFESLEKTGKVVWSSSDETVASVSDRGVVTALTEGTTTITAACGEYSHTCQITVSYVDVTEIRMIYPQMNLAINETSPVEVLTNPENGTASLQWTSSDESVATVDSMGNVTALDYGTATITAAARNDPNVTAQCTVNVILPVEDIYLDQAELFMSLQDNQAQLNVIYEPVDANFGQDITWSVDNRDILEISASGDHNETLTITALNCGAATVTAATADGHTVSCAVYIEDIIYVSSVEELQTQHNPYDSNVDRTWIYTDETKDYLFVTFDENTYLSGNDTLYVMDENRNVLLQGNGGTFSGRRVFVDGSTVQIRLVSGSNTNNYGFRVEEINDTIIAEDIQLEVYDQACTGKAITPEVYAYVHSIGLIEGEDYTLKFSNNKNVGTATVKFIGKGRLEGIEKETTFRIYPSGTQLSATADKNGITLTWTASKGAGNYDLYRSVNGGSMQLYKTLSGSAKKFTDKDTSAAYYYRYELKPYKNVTKNKVTTRYDGASASCGPVVRLGSVQNLTAVAEQTEGIAHRNFYVTLSWDALEGANGYYIYRSNDNGGYFTRYTSTSNTEYRIYVDEAGRTQFRIVPFKRVNGTTCEGSASNAVSVYGLDAPFINATAGQKGIYLYYSHRGLEGQTSIELQRSIDGGDWKKFKTIKTTDGHNWGEVIDTSAKKAGTYYQYRARVLVKDGKTTYYGPFSSVESELYLQTPSITSIRNAETGLDITWNHVAAAQTYTIERYNLDEFDEWQDKTIIYTVTEEDLGAKTITFTDDTATEAGWYEYYVRANAVKDGESYHSEDSDYKYGYVLNAPTLRYLGNAKKGIELSWMPVEYANGFEVWRSDNGGAFKRIKTLKDTTYFNDTGASKNGVEYQYQIRAYTTKDKNTFYSDFLTTDPVVKMTPPTLKKATALTTGGFELTFSAVQDAQAYQLWRYSGEGDGELVEEILQDPKAKTYTFTDTGATAENILYQYEIVAYRETEETYVDASWYVYCYNYGKAVVSVENAEKGLMVYASVPDAAGRSYADTYTIYRSENSGLTWKKLKTVKADMNGNLVYNDTAAKAGKTYSYKVVASGDQYMDAFTCQESQAVTMKCATGPKQAVPVNTREGVVISWSAQKDMPEAEKYQIWRSTDGYHFEMIGQTDRETFSFTDPEPRYDRNGYLEDNMYYYKVLAIPAKEEDPITASGIQLALACMATPEIYNCWQNGNTLYVSWDSEGYIDGFQVQYTTNGVTKTANAKMSWSYGLKKVKAGQEYEISVRGYYKYGKTTYYSAWSEPVTICTESFN